MSPAYQEAAEQAGKVLILWGALVLIFLPLLAAGFRMLGIGRPRLRIERQPDNEQERQ